MLVTADKFLAELVTCGSDGMALVIVPSYILYCGVMCQEDASVCANSTGLTGGKTGVNNTRHEHPNYTN